MASPSVPPANSLLDDYVARFRQEQELAKPHPLHEEPDWLRGNERKLIWRPTAPPLTQHNILSVEAARVLLTDSLRNYLNARDIPSWALLIQAAPGLGKTTHAVQEVQALAKRGRRILYAGPRHELFQQIIHVPGAEPDLWLEWLPRQAGDEGKEETCRYFAQISQWLDRGYEAWRFCASVCGYDYMTKGCPYHLQKRRTEPIVYGMHEHIVYGHPLDFHAVVGDECPLGVFGNTWRIPAKFVLPTGVDHHDSAAPLLSSLVQMASDGMSVWGEALISSLGGPEAVLQACAESALPRDPRWVAPEIRFAYEVDSLPYTHIPQLLTTLEREAHSMEQGIGCAGRARIGDGALTLLRRNKVNTKLPQRMIWLDATANEGLYEKCLQRKIEIVRARAHIRGTLRQIYSRANGKRTLVDKAGDETHRIAQTQALVEHLIHKHKYERAAVISFKALEARFAGVGQVGHFYSARGTNAFEGVDALFVVGTPQPNIEALRMQAAMIFDERDGAFDARWQTKEQIYAYEAPDGRGAGYPVSGFWGDDDMQELLWAYREAEIIHAAHRARPILYDVDVWLLTNVPLDMLPPDELMSAKEAGDAPEDGVNEYAWLKVKAVIRRLIEKFGIATVTQITVGADVSSTTALKYMTLLIERDPARWCWMTEPAIASTGFSRAIASKSS